MAAEAAEKRKRLIQVVGGIMVAAVAVVGIVLAVSSGGGTGASGDGPVANPDSGAPLPPSRSDDFQEAVQAAGCTFEEFDNEGAEHVDDGTELDFETNPPTSGPHYQVAAEDGVYASGNSPIVGNWVHSLEHGRVLLQYAPNAPARRVEQLKTLFNQPVATGPEGYHTLLMQNNTRMPYAVAAVAWTRSVGCERFTDRSFDVLRLFRDQYVDQGPELVP